MCDTNNIIAKKTKILIVDDSNVTLKVEENLWDRCYNCQ
jgi:hypothetical protein